MAESNIEFISTPKTKDSHFGKVYRGNKMSSGWPFIFDDPDTFEVLFPLWSELFNTGYSKTLKNVIAKNNQMVVYDYFSIPLDCKIEIDDEMLIDTLTTLNVEFNYEILDGNYKEAKQMLIDYSARQEPLEVHLQVQYDFLKLKQKNSFEQWNNWGYALRCNLLAECLKFKMSAISKLEDIRCIDRE